jgi:hypothetical protein
MTRTVHASNFITVYKGISNRATLGRPFWAIWIAERCPFGSCGAPNAAEMGRAAVLYVFACKLTINVKLIIENIENGSMLKIYYTVHCPRNQW